MAFGWRGGSGRFPATLFPVALLSTALLGSCDKPAPVTLPPPIVEVMEIKTSDIPLTGTLIGQLDSPQNIEIRARVEAFVDKIHFTEGTQVQQGDLLFELDKKPFLEKEASAKAELAEADAARTKFKQDLARLLPLADSKAISKQDLDNAKSNLEASEAKYLSADAKLKSAMLDLGYCEVRAPSKGLIGAKEVSEGDLVGKGEPTLLATMSLLDPIWFYSNISEVQYIKIQNSVRELGKTLESLPLTLILPNGEEHPQKGSIVFFDRAVNTKTGTMRLRAQFPNPTEILRPGMFTRARVEAGTREGIKVPERAIVELQGKTFLWIVDQDNKASQRQVKAGEPIGSEVTILEGVKPGERIIVEGLQKAREGAEVKPLTADEIAAANDKHAAAQPKH